MCGDSKYFLSKGTIDRGAHRFKGNQAIKLKHSVINYWKPLLFVMA